MSLNYNRVILAGRITRDPQLSYTPAQTPVVDFGLAINKRWKGKDGEKREETCFVDCRAFAKTAETINQYFTKGMPILVEGELHFSSWEDKQDGKKRSKLRVTVHKFEFMGDGEKQEAAPAPAPQPAPQQAPPAPQPAFGSPEDDGSIPF